MKRRARLTGQAASDLSGISKYTAKTWGKEQRRSYLAQLRHRIQWLADNPHLGIQRSDIRPDLYSFPEGEHLIFYSIATDTIAIVGVLHNRMVAKDKLG